MNSINHKKTFKQQQGAVLISALMFMIIMTMLAITSMGTNTLEERMAANAAATNVSFQIAESGVEVIADNISKKSAKETVADFSITDADYAGKGITVTSSATFVQEANTKRGKTPSDAGSSFHFYDLKSEVSNGGIPIIIHSGFYKEGPKINR